jgi:hypothetical protein
MATSDLSSQFEKISDRARAAADNLKGAEHRTRDRLESEADAARDRATAAADRLRDKWATHVANVGYLGARVAASDADFAEDYALDAIDFAAAAIDEAEAAVLGAMCARANADALASWAGE